MFVLVEQGAKVKVTRWYPGVLQAIVEEIHSKSKYSEKNIKIPGGKSKSVKDVLAHEAAMTLESKRNAQIDATKEKTLDQIKKEMGIETEPTPDVTPLATVPENLGLAPPPTTTRRRVRQKMRSTPVTGGSLFDGPKAAAPEEPKAQQTKSQRHEGAFSDSAGGSRAELVVNGEVFNIRVMPETIHRIRSGYSGELLEDASVRFSNRDVPVEARLQGFIRTGGLSTITEDTSDTASKHPSEVNSEDDPEW